MSTFCMKNVEKKAKMCVVFCVQMIMTTTVAVVVLDWLSDLGTVTPSFWCNHGTHTYYSHNVFGKSVLMMPCWASYVCPIWRNVQKTSVTIIITGDAFYYEERIKKCTAIPTLKKKHFSPSNFTTKVNSVDIM